MRKFLLIVLALGMACGCLTSQATLTVPSTSYPTIQSAIDAATNGDTIQIAAGTYVENLTITGKHLTIIGAGPGVTILDANGAQALTLAPGGAGTTTIAQLDLVGGGGPGASVLAQRDLLNEPAWTLVLDFVRLRLNSSQGLLAQAGIHLEMRDSIVELNNPTSDGHLVEVRGELTLLRTQFRNNDLSALASIVASWRVLLSVPMANEPVTITDSEFIGNVTFGVLSTVQSGALSVSGCRFADNDASGVTSLFHFNCLGNGEIRDCLVTGNLTTGNRVVTIGGSIALRRTTIADNRRSTSTGFVLSLAQPPPLQSAVMTLESVIVADNDLDTVELNNSESITMRNSLLEAGFLVPSVATLPNPPNPTIVTNDLLIGLEAGFVDAANGDLRLRPGSPCVDAGFADPSTPATDLNGEPRIVGAAVDMGCFELQNQDPGADFAGTVSVGDVLKFNGTAGGTQRSVTVDAGSVCTISMDAPGNAAAAPFIVWGYLGIPDVNAAYAIDFAGGSMAFRPHLEDLGNPLLFTFTNNLLTPNSGLVFSTPAPWSATGPCAGFPITMTLQGLIADGSGPLAITNAITLHSR